MGGRWWQLTRQAAAAWQEDHASSMGAALSYYTLFSIAPLLLIVISLAGLFFGEAAARGEIMQQLEGLRGADGARAVAALLKSVNRPAAGILATAAGILTLLIGATGVFAELQNDLDRIWRAPAAQGGGLWRLVRTRLHAFGIVLGFAFLLIVSLVVSAAIAAIGKFWSGMLLGWTVVAQVVDFGVDLALMTVLFAMIYKIMPRVRIAWRDVWIGAAVTALLFAIGKFLIGLYLGRSSVASVFGAAGSLVLVMVWVYYSAQIFLFGAEFTWVYSHACGSRQDIATAQRAAKAASTARGPAAQPSSLVSVGLAAVVGVLLALLTRRSE
jgi:membrane protein